MFQINFMMYNQRFVQKFKNKLWEVFIDNHQVKQSFAVAVIKLTVKSLKMLQYDLYTD